MDSISRLFAQLKHTDDSTFIKKTIAYHGALIHHGLKPAVFISFRQTNYKIANAWIKYSQKSLKEYGLNAYPIYQEEDRFAVMLYNEQALNDVLSMQDVRQWLYDYAQYPIQSKVEIDLAFLKQRFQVCSCPSELGIFLGYPMEDVFSYVQHQGKNFEYCGYWKVYHNIGQCMKRFQEYDRVRMATAERLLDPQSSEIAI